MYKFIKSTEEIHNALFGPRPNPTIKCTKCGTLYKAENESYPWEYDNFLAKNESKSKYFGLCRNCYKAELNNNLTNADIRHYAEYAINNTSEWSMGYNKADELSYENWENKVKPMIDVILAERQAAKEKLYHESKFKEAEKLYNDAKKDATLDDNITIHIIAKLLEKIDELEKKIPERDISNIRFNV